MALNQVPQTDPARELADVCSSLAVPTDLTGDNHLAASFGVEAWSVEFYQIISCILERIDFLIAIVHKLDDDEDIKAEAVEHLANIRSAFAKSSLINPWNYVNHGGTLVSNQNSRPIKMLSGSVRKIVSYPKLTQVEIDLILEDASEYENWLSDQQLVEHDFIRQAILEGLKQFKFRLSKFGWFGYGYTFDSLKDIITAYKMLEGSVLSPESDLNAEAILKKGMSFFKKVFTTTGVAKDTVERTDFLLRAYGLISLIYQGTPVAGLLAHMTN